MKPFDPPEFAPSALDERFDGEMDAAFEAMPKTRCTISEIETALGGGPLDKLDAAAFADPCRRYPLPHGPLSKGMIRSRLQLLLFRNGTSDLHEHMEDVFDIAPIEDRDAWEEWEDDSSGAEGLGLTNEQAGRAQGLTKRLWKIAMIYEAFVRAMLEGDLGWALILGFREFDAGDIGQTSETVARIVEDMAPLWLFADLQMGANACRLRRDKPAQMPFWANKNSSEVPRLFKAINEMNDRIAEFEQVRDIYYRDLRRPVSNFVIPAPSSHLDSAGWLGSSSTAAFAITLSQYAREATAEEARPFEADGTADKARALLVIWREEHGDDLEAFIEFRMKESDRKLRVMHKRLERLHRIKRFSSLDLASYNQTRPLPRLVLACKQAAAWLPPPFLPSEGEVTGGQIKQVETKYKARPSPIREAIKAIADAVEKLGCNANALAQAKIRIPAPKASSAKRARDLNYLFANLIVEGMQQEELLERWDKGGSGNEAFVRRTAADRLAPKFRKQFEKQRNRKRHREVDQEAHGSLAWRLRHAGALDVEATA